MNSLRVFLEKNNVDNIENKIAALESYMIGIL